VPLSPEEILKRKRERSLALFAGLFFIFFTILQSYLSDQKEDYGFFQSLLYFGLLHLNIILLCLLGFLLIRNLFKAYMQRKTNLLGSGLRWRLISSLLSFSLLPSILLFLGSTYIMRQGFDQWFGVKVQKVIEDSSNLSKIHYQKIEDNLSYYLQSAQEDLNENFTDEVFSEALLRKILRRYPLSFIEFYESPRSRPLKVWVKDFPHKKELQKKSIDLKKAFKSLGAVKDLLSFEEGELLRVSRVIRDKDNLEKLLVFGEWVPLSLKSKVLKLEKNIESYQKTKDIKSTLKTHYTLVLLLLFLLTLFVAAWFGLYLTKEVTEPVEELMEATDAFRTGNWDYRIESAQKKVLEKRRKKNPDLEILKSSFNLMAEEVSKKGSELESANVQLLNVIKDIEEREQYLETLLSNIGRGVLVINEKQKIERINKEAIEFVSTVEENKGEAVFYLGKDWRGLFRGISHLMARAEFLGLLRSNKGKSIDRVFDLSLGQGRSEILKSIRVTGVYLTGNHQEELGWMLIFEDASVSARVERLAAWQGVARRVAHEIKNPLTPIQLSADRMMRKLIKGELVTDNKEFLNECLGQIQKQVRVIRDLVREFSQFAKMPEAKFEKLKLSHFLKEQLKDYRFTYPHFQFEFTESINSEKIFIQADPEHFRSLVVNLMDNAIHSIEESKSEKKEMKITLELLANQNLKICFADSGPGVDQAMVDKIFDPYISSKASGIGLGLAIVRRIAEEHRGRIYCQEAQGGLFVLEIPRFIEEKEAYV